MTKDPVADAYARGGRVASRKYGDAVKPTMGAGSFPKMEVKARPPRRAQFSAPRQSAEKPLEPSKVFPVARQASARARTGPVARADDAVAVEDDSLS